jgi:alkanesulfonate monooxygenase SsuD/methylene tetrahydromethanopterin reductase-like flavin-dependent oxidoreductase (luciferase family)
LKLGLHFDLRNPPQWRQDWSRLYGFTLEMCEEVERLGGDSVWIAEHHQFEDGHMTQPLTFAAAIAARTRRVRIGTGVLLAPLRPAIQIAEDAAIVDITSNGRLDLGIGAGYRAPEFAAFGAGMKERYATNDARARELRAIWGDPQHMPKPVQQHLPIWMGYQGPNGARRAGRLGENLLTANAKMWEPYRAALVEAGYDPARARMSGNLQSWVSEDPEADWPVVSKHVAYLLDSYRRYMVEGTERPVPRPVDPDKLRQRGMDDVLSYYYCDTPTAIAAKIKAYTAGAPVDTVFLWASIAGMPEKMVARHVQTVCTQLRPLLA